VALEIFQMDSHLLLFRKWSNHWRETFSFSYCNQISHEN